MTSPRRCNHGEQQWQQQPQPTQQSTLLQKWIVIENVGACDINMFIGNIKNKLKNTRWQQQRRESKRVIFHVENWRGSNWVWLIFLISSYRLTKKL